MDVHNRSDPLEAQSAGEREEGESAKEREAATLCFPFPFYFVFMICNLSFYLSCNSLYKGHTL